MMVQISVKQASRSGEIDVRSIDINVQIKMPARLPTKPDICAVKQINRTPDTIISKNALMYIKLKTENIYE